MPISCYLKKRNIRLKLGLVQSIKMTWHKPRPFSKNCPVMKIPSQSPVDQSLENFETKLSDLKNDLSQTKPIDNEAIESKMIDTIIRLMEENYVPYE